MDGVTILNTYTERTSIAGVVVGIVLISLLLILALVTIFKESKGFSECNIDIILLTVIAVLLAVGVIALVSLSIVEHKEAQTLYEVTISDEVTFKDFTSKYQIVEQRGNIYVVKERENNDGT